MNSCWAFFSSFHFFAGFLRSLTLVGYWCSLLVSSHFYLDWSPVDRHIDAWGDILLQLPRALLLLLSRSQFSLLVRRLMICLAPGNQSRLRQVHINWNIPSSTYLAIWARTCASTLVGSMICSLPRTLIKLDIFTLGSSGASKPNRILSWRSFQFSLLFWRRNFLCSFFVKNIGTCTGLELSIGRSWIGCSMRLEMAPGLGTQFS